MQWFARSCIILVHGKGSDGPVFLTLAAPYRPLSSSAVAGVLNWSIVLAGLDPKLYTAKNFRPTGATLAVENGMDAEQVRVLGRWKTSETFFKHYVHARPHLQMSTAIVHNNNSLD